MAKWTKQEIANKVELEGLGYMVQHYMSADYVEDPVLAKWWRTAKEALDEIEAMLPKPEFDED
jgi:hypothetical protein